MVQSKSYKLLYSKWFYYILIGIILLFFMFVVFPILLDYGIIDNDLNLNLFSETWGLLFTLLFFVMLFELREFLEWKKVESRVKKKIGRQLNTAFVNVTSLCKVDTRITGNPRDLEAWKDLCRRQLKQLTTKKIELDFSEELSGDSKLANHYALLIDSLRQTLSNIEDKYFKFLNSELQCSLMDIQEEMEKIYWELKRPEFLGKKDANRITESIGKIMKEIEKLRKSGIDVGF